MIILQTQTQGERSNTYVNCQQIQSATLTCTCPKTQLRIGFSILVSFRVNPDVRHLHQNSITGFITSIKSICQIIK